MAELTENHQNGEPIAIVGMGCRWPGGVRDASGLWQLLKEKRSGYKDFGEPRFSSKGFYHPNHDRPGSMATKGGFLLDEDPRLFDPSFFNITGLELETMDASQRKLLEVVYEAFENAGETWDSISGSSTGVFIGNFSLDHWVTQARDWDYPRPYATTGASTSILGNRISYIFNLKGPSLAIDTACSSSMYAVHLAVNAIRSGDCDSAIVAAANWIMDPSLQIALDKLGALSSTSTCHTFDISADGYARGEGFAAIYLKRMDKAVAEESPIRSVIRGTAVNANGRTGGITRPSAPGQEAVIRKAYANAGNLDMSETTYFEMHGTGTPVGDPIEVAAVGNAFASVAPRDPGAKLFVGSVKTNLGHTEGASALAAIMKVVLSLEAGMIPPSIGIKTLNPAIDFEKANVEVVRELMTWPKDRLRRASINSFGFGGANGHIIVDHVSTLLPEYMKPGVIRHSDYGSNGVAVRSNGLNTNGHSTNGLNTNGHSINGYTKSSNGESTATNGHKTNGAAIKSNGHSNGTATYHSPINPGKLMLIKRAEVRTRDLVLLPFSAHDTQALKANIAAISEVVGGQSLADTAYTLAAKRSRLLHRTFRIVEKDAPVSGLAEDQKTFQAPTSMDKIAFVFTGQGAQWHAMGSQLAEYHVFQTAIAYLDHVLGTLPDGPSWKIADIVAGQCEEGAIQEPEVSQTVCTALQIALVDLLASWNVRPSGVVGHSSGEMAAAYAGGYLTAAEAITAAYFRGSTVATNTQEGAMIAVGMGPDKAAGYLTDFDGQIKVAAINSPESTTLSGDKLAVHKLAETLTSNGEFNRLLRTGGNAYHSHHMKPLGREYSTRLADGLAHVQGLGLSNKEERYPRVPWISSVTPSKPFPDDTVEVTYWQANLESPVRFSEAISKMVDSISPSAILEVGPHAALKGPIDQTVRSQGSSIPYVSTLKRKEDARISMLSLAGTLFASGAPVDLVAVNAVDEFRESTWAAAHGSTAVDLPPYRYNYGPIKYNESRVSKEYRLRSTLRHDIVGSKVPGTARLRPQWRNILRLKDLPWLGDHRLIPYAVFPAAGFFTMALVAASYLHQENHEPLRISGYSLRNVNIKTALRIPEDDYGVEVILSMELSEEATGQSPQWASFSVSSVARDSEEWSEHCTGLVKVEVSQPMELSKIGTAADPRPASARTWYKTFAALGLGYGPTFQGLSDIRVDPGLSRAVATVGLQTTAGTIVGESSYPLHPASLDSIFQLGLIACYGGQVDKARNAFVPVHLSRLYLKHTDSQNEYGTATAHGELRGLRGAYAKMQLSNQDGDIVMDIDSLRCISYLDGKPPAGPQSNQFSSPFSRLVWRPDIRFMNDVICRQMFPPPQENVDQVHLFPVMNKFAAVVLADLYQSLLSGEERPEFGGNGRHFADWVVRRVESSGSEEIAEAQEMSRDDRLRLLDELYAQGEGIIEVKIAKRLHENMAAILHEKKTAVEVLVQDGLLTALYETGLFMTSAYPQLFSIFESLGHANPNQRILELGAGTGGATRVAMRALVGTNGIKRYKDYTFTDISAGFLTSARESLSEHLDVNFSVLDIEHDPLSQGYEASYDVVMASQTLHATASIANTLENCRRLLKPGGKLVLVENTQNRDLVGIILGTLTGYWHGKKDGRTDSPFLTRAAWDQALRSAGFSGTELILSDYPEPNATTTVLVSTLVPSETSELQNGSSYLASSTVHLLYGSSDAPILFSQMKDELQRGGAKVELASFRGSVDSLPRGARVVAYLDDAQLLLNANEEELERFKRLIANSQSLLLLTSGGIGKGQSPETSFIPGLLRTLMTENPGSKFVSVDIEAKGDVSGLLPDDGHLLKCLVALEGSLQKDDVPESRDSEFVWQNGCMWVSRFVPDDGLATFTESPEAKVSRRSQLAPIDSQGPVRAAFETPGILSSLYFRPYSELQEPLPHDWIVVKVAAIGLNWKDLGLSSGRFDGNNLSSEYSGTIVEIGSGVTALRVGERVYGMGRGHFGNYTRVPSAFARKLQPQDDIVEVATMPLVYMTAVYAFEHIARLRKGQSVLIQSATGGLGLAAIQLAQSKGAVVYATVGTQEKAQFLQEKMNVPASHIFSSRSISELSTAADNLPAGGFNVILSTSQGEMLYASLRAVAPLGHLIDVGRSEVGASKTMGLELFQKSATFSSFDLSLVLDRDPELGSELMGTVDKYFRAGQIGPVRPFTTSCISKLDSTLLGFSKGTHVGKLVVTFQPEALVRMAPPSPAASFDPGARYIVSGGLGGLGRAIVAWMCDHGARDVVILSRRGVVTEESRMFIEAQKARGLAIQAVKCDVSSLDDVLRAVRDANSADRPIKGVIHAAVSYQDISFNKMSIERWHSSLAAKVQGTRNLHEATLDLPLDFFVMTTSMESVFALATQSAYTAANVFQDAFARYRRQLGLPASTVSFGFVSDVGSLATDATTVDMFARNKTQTLTESQFLAHLEPAFINHDAGNSWDGMHQDPLSVANLFTCLDPAILAKMKHEETVDGASPSSAPLPQWYNDARISLIMRAFEDADRHMHGNGQGGAHKLDSDDTSPRAVAARLRRRFEDAIGAAQPSPDQSDLKEVLDFTEDALVNTIADMLFIDAAGVDRTKTVADHGIDSLISAELRNWLLMTFGSNVGTLDLLDAHTTISQLAARIVNDGVLRLKGTTNGSG